MSTRTTWDTRPCGKKRRGRGKEEEKEGAGQYRGEEEVEEGEKKEEGAGSLWRSALFR